MALNVGSLARDRPFSQQARTAGLNNKAYDLPKEQKVLREDFWIGEHLVSSFTRPSALWRPLTGSVLEEPVSSPCG